MRRIILVMGILFALGLLLAACGGGGKEATEESTVQVPSEYAGKTNPFSGDAAAVTAGQVVYASNCASCHGDKGAGDGPAGTALDPKPSDLRDIPEGDDYINWRIHEGGSMEPFKSSMPAWKGVISDDDIWRLVTYIRTL